jgi:hypothetical protein
MEAGRYHLAKPLQTVAAMSVIWLRLKKIWLRLKKRTYRSRFLGCAGFADFAETKYDLVTSPDRVVAGLKAVGRYSRHEEYKTQCSNAQGQDPFTVISSSWRSRRRHCPAQRTPFGSRIWGTSLSALRARRWFLYDQTSSRISCNDIGR